MRTAAQLAAHLRDLLAETQQTARTMVKDHGPASELDQRADRAQMLLIRPALEMLVTQLDAQAAERRALSAMARMLSSPDRMAQMQALRHARAALQQDGVQLQVELGAVDPHGITICISAPQDVHDWMRDVRDLLAQDLAQED